MSTNAFPSSLQETFSPLEEGSIPIYGAANAFEQSKKIAKNANNDAVTAFFIIFRFPMRPTTQLIP